VQAIALQRAVARAVETTDRLGPVRRVAGVDVAYGARGRSSTARAAVVVLDADSLELREQVAVEVPARFPYVPGLLSFREAPAAIAALERLSRPPDLLLCDGQGLAHPRRCGFASHLGVVVDRPSIGVAKSRLTGTHADPPSVRGGWTTLFDRDEEIGACVCTRVGARPLYVSSGHRVSLATALAWVMRCTTRYRLPEPIRLADRLSKQRGTDQPARSHSG